MNLLFVPAFSPLSVGLAVVENNGKFLDFEAVSSTLKGIFGGIGSLGVDGFLDAWMEETRWSECL
ncbi:MAG: hypothetical protein OXH06_14905 [Gemmatimonadetes bacterium]|nr:hypothetical protein [Gemmatimonadota bacterium]